ncbi:MAG: CDP-glucose 4,6-dehydratase [Desulfuromonadales bacterium]
MASAKRENRASFWKGKSVFLTGHTGFKGSWLSLWMHALGVQVTGYALDPPTEPNLYHLAGIQNITHSTIGDIRDSVRLHRMLMAAEPEIVIHMAAQPLVRESYLAPVNTYATNVMGTVNLLESVRQCPSVRVVLNITSDKCYANQELDQSFREDAPLGGYDPYSSSKACSELITTAYRSSYFNPLEYPRHRVAIATARAGNVIGGGDWAKERLIPDCIRALLANEPVRIRNPHAIRPWQHVLEPLSGYLMLAQKLYEEGVDYAGGWNFGPSVEDARPVEWIVNRLCERWGNGARYEIECGDHPHEAHRLTLDCSKATMRLGWRPRWNLDKALTAIMEWVTVYSSAGDVKKCCLEQIEMYAQTNIT